MIRQHRKSLHVAFDHTSRTKDFATDGIAENVIMQPLPQAPSFWQFENAAVVNDAGADVTALQRDDPDPPAAAEEMISSPFTGRATIISVIWKTFSPLVAVPLLHSAESRPDCVDGVLGVRTKMSEFPGEHGRAPCGIDDPTR